MSKDKGMREILEKVKQSGNYEFHSTYTITQAETEIKQSFLKEIEGKFPQEIKETFQEASKKMTKKNWISNWDYDMKQITWNACRKKALKVLKEILGGKGCQ